MTKNGIYEFQSHVFSTKLMNKISNKVEAEKESKPMPKGRNINELKDKLNTIEKFI